MRIAYGDQVIIDGLDWTIDEGSTGNWWDRMALASRPCSPSSPEITRKVTTMSSICSGRRRGGGENLGDQAPHRAREPGAASGLSCQLPGADGDPPVSTTPSGFIPGRDRQLALANQWLALLGLADQGRNLSTLSFGQQRLVLIARALVKHPPLLILDEPLQGLDPSTVTWCGDGSAPRGRGTQLLFVSHHADDAPPV